MQFFFYADNEDSDQTGQKYRLIRVSVWVLMLDGTFSHFVALIYHLNLTKHVI